MQNGYRGGRRALCAPLKWIWTRRSLPHGAQRVSFLLTRAIVVQMDAWAPTTIRARRGR